MVDTENKAESHCQMEKEIREILMAQNKKYQVDMDMKMATLQESTYTKEQIVLVVDMIRKFGENNQTNPNLKRDTTHDIVSPLKKSRQTEEDSGLMQTE